MRLEAIAALVGHQKMEMTLIYARIVNRVVADEYAAASAKIDALYGQPPALPADYQSAGMARLRREAHARMLGNGLCARPAELDCCLETACENCAYFRTSILFPPILPGGVTTSRPHRHRGYSTPPGNRTGRHTSPPAASAWGAAQGQRRCRRVSSPRATAHDRDAPSAVRRPRLHRHMPSSGSCIRAD